MSKIVLGFAMVVIISISLVSLYFVNPVTIGNENEKISLLLMQAVSGFGIILWFWMIVDLLREKGMKFKRLWILSFLVFNIFAAVTYFLFVYYPYEKLLSKSKIV